MLQEYLDRMTDLLKEIHLFWYIVVEHEIQNTMVIRYYGHNASNTYFH